MYVVGFQTSESHHNDHRDVYTCTCTVPDIIKFTYCTSSVLQVYCTVLHLSTMLSHTNVKEFTHYYDYSTE